MNSKHLYIGHTLDTLISKYSSEVFIDWILPTLYEEYGEYFENEDTIAYLNGKGISFQNEEELLNVLSTGVPQEITKEILVASGVNVTTSTSDFRNELVDDEYAKSYHDMEDTLNKERDITLPMPILLKIGPIYYGFAGNRRMNLAWNYNLDVTFFVVTLQ